MPPLLLLASIFPSIRVFSSESELWIRWPKYWSFGFSISPSNEYSGLISFRIDLFDLHVVQRTLKSPLQHHNSKASILWLTKPSLWSNSHIHTWLLEKPLLWLYGPLTKQTRKGIISNRFWVFMICVHKIWGPMLWRTSYNKGWRKRTGQSRWTVMRQQRPQLSLLMPWSWDALQWCWD